MNGGKFLCDIFFRIAQTLSTKKFHTEFRQTQAFFFRILALLLFAFLGFGCATNLTQSAVPSPAPVPTELPIAPAEPSISPTQTFNAKPTVAPPIRFEGKHAYDEYLLAQMKFGIRPAGSKAIRAAGDYIIQELKKSGWDVETQEFVYRGIPVRNIIGKFGSGDLIILGAHYDTRPRANQDESNPNGPVPGANDGASGVAVLLELARTLDKAKLKDQVWLAFFDAEDNGDLNACDLRVVEMQTATTGVCDTTPWTWSIGASHVAGRLPRKPTAVIVVDMIGDADQNIYYEHNSDKLLQETLWKIAAQLGDAQWFIPQYRWSMSDDHTPFLQRGIRAVDIIDFDYPSWHTTQDTADKVSAESLERVGQVLETWLESGQQ